MHRLGQLSALALLGAVLNVSPSAAADDVAAGAVNGGVAVDRGDLTILPVPLPGRLPVCGDMTIQIYPLPCRPIAPGEPAPGRGFGIGTFITGLGGVTPSNSILRFVNQDRSAGAVTLTLYDAASGTQLATWTSASVPAGAGIEVSMARVVTAATPALTAAQQTSVLNASVMAAFRGDYQQLSLTGGAVINQSACSGDRFLGYVEGPGYTGLSGAVRLSNPSSAAGTITAAIYDAATGTSLGSWTSASVPAHGAITVSASALAAATSPAVPTSTAGLNIVPTGATARLKIEHLAAVTGQSTASNLTAACPL